MAHLVHCNSCNSRSTLSQYCDSVWIGEHTSDKPTCDICGIDFNAISERAIKCYTCNWGLLTTQTLVIHAFREHHITRAFQCATCLCHFSTRSRYMKHQQQHPIVEVVAEPEPKAKHDIVDSLELLLASEQQYSSPYLTHVAYQLECLCRDDDGVATTVATTEWLDNYMEHM